MTEQIIFKLGSRCPNEAAIAAGFEFAKGARVPVRAYFLEDEMLAKASRYSFSNEIRLFGASRGLEVHELRRETKIAMRAISREMKRRSEAAQIDTEFVALNGDGQARMQAQAERENVFVLGEAQTARQLTRDFLKLKAIGGLRGVLMAGPQARVVKGPVAILTDDYQSWKKGLPLLQGFLLTAASLSVFCLGDSIDKSDEMYADLANDFGGDVEFQGIRRFDQSRLVFEIERTKASLLFAVPNCSLIEGEKKLEAFLRSLSCPLFISL